VPQWTVKRANARVLEQVNQVPQGAIVSAERVRSVKVPGAFTTERAKTGFVQRVLVEKRCATEGAEVISGKRLQAGDAAFADGIRRVSG
jgi:hypothetical protein